MRVLNTVVLWMAIVTSANAQVQLVGHWPLQSTTDDHSAGGLKSKATGVTFANDGPTKTLLQSGVFDGVSSVINVENAGGFNPGKQDFSIAAWVKAADDSDDVPGDLLSQFDFSGRTGFHLGLYTHGGVTNSQSNLRQLHFGIDQARIEPDFTDHGKLGSAVYVFSLCVHNGRLYASTCHAGANESGRVFRFEGNDRWTDLGAPDSANAISAMTVFNGSLHVASSKYRLAGSSLAESENKNNGGKVYRLDDADQWVSCGTLSPETEAVSSLIEYRGKLYAGSLYKPAGFFRYDGGEVWTACTNPGKRVEAMTVFNGSLYASCYDEGAVFRFDGEQWHDMGRIPNATQTYGFAVHQGSLFVSEWPQAHVFRHIEGTNWQDAGKLGEELEAMPLVVYNGKMYGGSLPLAEVYRYEGKTDWARVGRVDLTPEVRFRRAWSMAVYQGRLFVGALPSGHVLSIEAGRNATWDYSFPSGWHHVAAVRAKNNLQLYVDGKLVSESAALPDQVLDLSSDAKLQIGFGAQDYFKGNLADVRIYQGALTTGDIAEMAVGQSSLNSSNSSEK